MKKWLSIFLWSVLSCAQGFGQTVFFEDFEGEADGATTGTDQFGTNWTATCPYCGASGDWNEVNDVSGAHYLEGTDTNGPAYWETDEIDISACTQGITISLDLSHVSTLEGQQASCALGCNSVDVVKLEVSYDGGASWTPYSDATYGTTTAVTLACDCGTCGSPSTAYPVPWCGATLDGPTIATGGFAAHTFSDCISVGVSSTVRLRVTTMTWAGAEKIRIDNVTLACSSCALPVELNGFDGFRTENRSTLQWVGTGEVDFKKYNVERSTDGIVFQKIGSVIGRGGPNESVQYDFLDEHPPEDLITYYRISQEDINGETKYSETIQLTYTPTNIYHDGTNLQLNFQELPNTVYHLKVYDLSGKLVFTQIVQNQSSIPWTSSGYYLLEIPEIELKQKIIVQ